MSWLGRMKGVRRFASDAQQMPCVEGCSLVVVVMAPDHDPGGREFSMVQSGRIWSKLWAS